MSILLSAYFLWPAAVYLLIVAMIVGIAFGLLRSRTPESPHRASTRVWIVLLVLLAAVGVFVGIFFAFKVHAAAVALVGVLGTTFQVVGSSTWRPKFTAEGKRLDPHSDSSHFVLKRVADRTLIETYGWSLLWLSGAGALVLALFPIEK